MTPNIPLEEYVRATVAEICDLTPDQIQASDRLREDLGLDSLQSMELLSRVSEHYDIDPDLEALAELATLDDVIGALGSLVEVRPS